MTITCPHCRHSRETDPDRFPAHPFRVRCPRCQGVFFLPQGDRDPVCAPEMPESRPDRPPAEPVPPPRTKGADEGPRRRQVSFTFTGSAREYFGIWSVNTLLQIVTLGLYTPWAKVRKRQYFYGNTLLDQIHFEYTADPRILLKGFLLGAALFLVYTAGSRFAPEVGSLFGLLFFLLAPWLVVRSRMFTARYSSHRNIRFSFEPRYPEAYAAFAWLPVLTPFTLGILFPYVLYRQRRFLVENGRFGRTPFAFDGSPRDFYLLALKVLGMAFAVGACGLLFLGGLLPGVMVARPAFFPVVPIAVFALAYLLMGIYAYTRLTNLTWNSTLLGGHRFQSSLRARDMVWIYASNAAAIALSLGLLAPWSAVRLARYRLTHLALEMRGDLGQVVAAAPEEVGAAGEEIGDIFGLEVGF